MELKHYFIMLRRWAWLIALSTILAAAISYEVSTQLPRIYSSTATLMVGQVLQASNPNAADFSTGEQLAQTYALIVRRQPLLQATVDALGMNVPWQVLLQRVSAASVPQTQLLQITVIDTSPQGAALIADEVAHQLILQSPTRDEKEQDQRQQFVTQQLALLQGRINDAEEQSKVLESRLAIETSARGVGDAQSQLTALQQKMATWQTTYANLLNQKQGRVNNLSIVEPAVISLTPISPNTLVNVATAAAVGAVLALAAALVLEYLDDTLKTAGAAERVLNVISLGTVVRMHRRPRQPKERVVAMLERDSPLAEAYRVIRTNVQFASLRRSARTLLITSAVGGEGKTTTACNLAVTMAQAGKRVILCDADLRRPLIHEVFGVPHDMGLTSLLLDSSMPPDEVLVPTPVPGLMVLPSGPLPPNPAELLGWELMRRRVEELKQLADVVLFDGPAVLPIADAVILGSLCDSVIMVVDAARTRPEQAKQAKERLDRVGLDVLGVILNKTDAGTHTSGYYRRARLPQTRIWPRLTALWSGLLGGR